MRGRLIGSCALVTVAMLLAGCTSLITPPRAQTDRDRVTRYFADLNASAKQGPEAQQRFLDDTRHPDFADEECDLKGLTLDVYAALSTLRPDPNWAPEGAKPPRGIVYVLGVSLTVRRSGATIGEQIDSARVALLDGRVYGFPPCPTS